MYKEYTDLHDTRMELERIAKKLQVQAMKMLSKSKVHHDSTGSSGYKSLDKSMGRLDVNKWRMEGGFVN